MLAFGIAGDLLRALPESERPSSEELLASLVALGSERGGPVILHPLHDVDRAGAGGVDGLASVPTTAS